MDAKRCHKCGREVAENMAFCTECLAEMEKYPVKPGVVVLLPRHEQTQKSQKRRFSQPSPEEQIQKLKKRVKALVLALILALAAAAATGWMAVTDFLQDTDVRLPGQNYSSESNVQPEEK